MAEFLLYLNFQKKTKEWEITTKNILKIESINKGIKILLKHREKKIPVIIFSLINFIDKFYKNKFVELEICNNSTKNFVYEKLAELIDIKNEFI